MYCTKHTVIMEKELDHEAQIRVCAAVNAVCRWDEKWRDTALYDMQHPVWLLENRDEVTAFFLTIKRSIPKAADLPLSEQRGTPSADLIRKATAGERTWMRIAATFAAAVLSQYLWHWRTGDSRPSRALTALALIVDHLGQGGSRGLGFGTSARDGAFCHLGSGRRQANDGAAWDAARAQLVASYFPLNLIVAEAPDRSYEDPVEEIVIRHGVYLHGIDDVLLSVADIMFAAKQDRAARVLIPFLGRSLLKRLSVPFEGEGFDVTPGWEVELCPSTLQVIFDEYMEIKYDQEDTRENAGW